MQDFLLVRRCNTRADLPSDLDSLVLGESSDPAQQRRQILAVDVLHRKVMQTADLADVEDATDVGVRYLPGDPDLVEEPVQAFLVPLEFFGKELERHGLTQFQILGAVNLAHAAAAEQSDDPVALVQHRTGHETGVVQ